MPRELPDGCLPLTADDPVKCGRFTLIGRLGEGGMGVVYLATELNGAFVAVKRVRAQMAAQPEFRARLAREVQAMKAVHGPYTANIVAANVSDTPQWLAMRYVPGPTLADEVTKNGPMAPAKVRILATSLALALADIHAADVVHRDLKPSNIILSPDGPVVVDFGVAAAADATSLTTTGQAIGSLAWMAPEQLDGRHETTAAADIHAWAAVVTYAATGNGPYGAGSSSAIAWRITTQEPVLTSLPAELADLEPVLQRSLVKSPKHRPTSKRLVAMLDPELAGADGDSAEATALMQAAWAKDRTVAMTAGGAGARTAAVASDDKASGPLGANGTNANGANTKGKRKWVWLGAASATVAALALGATAFLVLGGTNDVQAAASPSSKSSPPSPSDTTMNTSSGGSQAGTTGSGAVEGVRTSETGWPVVTRTGPNVKLYSGLYFTPTSMQDLGGGDAELHGYLTEENARYYCFETSDQGVHDTDAQKAQCMVNTKRNHPGQITITGNCENNVVTPYLGEDTRSDPSIQRLRSTRSTVYGTVELYEWINQYGEIRTGSRASSGDVILAQFVALCGHQPNVPRTSA